MNLPKAVPKPISCFRGIPAASFACAADGAKAAQHDDALLHAVVRARTQGVRGRGANLLFADVVDSVSM